MASRNGAKHEGTGPRQLTGRTMSDHIVVFDGNPRLIGQTVAVDVVEATSFTLFGKVVTDEQVGVDRAGYGNTMGRHEATVRRIGLPVV